MRRTKIGLVAGGLGAYWPQFPDLLPTLRRSADAVSTRLRAIDADVVDAGFVSDAEDSARAAEQLRMMRGDTHRLVSAVVAARDGVPVWRHVDSAKLHVRAFSDAFIETYLDAEWPAISGCVGCFRIEGPGVQIFSRVEGSQFTILGMPLLPLLGWLRDIGEMPA